MSDTKVCTKCKIPKKETEFYSHSTTTDRLRSHCKSCCITQSANWAKQNHEKKKTWRSANKEKQRTQNRESHQRTYMDPEKKKELQKRNREWASNHREHIRTYQNARRKKLRDNKERLADYLIQKYGNTPCIDCRDVFAWCAMDFDHRPDEVKELKIGGYSSRKANPTLIAKIEKEITKCDLICSNCHRIRTEKRANNE